MGSKYTTFKTIERIPKKNIEKFFNLLENSNLSIALLDENLKACFFNLSYSRLVKVDQKSILGKDTYEINKNKVTCHAKFQPYYQVETKVVLQGYMKELERNHTLDLVFTYKLYEPKKHYIHTHISFRKIFLGSKLYILIVSTKLDENVQFNPFNSRKKKKKKKKKKRRLQVKALSEKNNTSTNLVVHHKQSLQRVSNPNENKNFYQNYKLQKLPQIDHNKKKQLSNKTQSESIITLSGCSNSDDSYETFDNNNFNVTNSFFLIELQKEVQEQNENEFLENILPSSEVIDQIFSNYEKN
ncbi:hypothetical protein M0813_05626 [Anaeramoeba flamelloides]|uniref:Uncharacterized protein n=1 Tax=Anaeramoeba flamelloides TaxID=1746091 RepID=A0ABQ8XFY4_9EUKA|nr:hypothetical protein M0813_05626 [Anaeramoeba flamelloides]